MTPYTPTDNFKIFDIGLHLVIRNAKIKKHSKNSNTQILTLLCIKVGPFFAATLRGKRLSTRHGSQ